MARALAALLVLSCGIGCGSSRPRTVTLPRDPFVGLACHRLGQPCRRLGVAVWTAGRARRVTVLLDGHTVVLHTGRGRGAYGRGLFWQAFFRDRNADLLASRYPSPITVRVDLVARDGTRLQADAFVPVSGGYG